MSINETTVLYIGGMGRSGSTLLEYLLAQVDGYFAAGELKFIWRNGLVDNELCGCGSPFLRCPFWTGVGQSAFGGWGNVDAESMLALQRQASSASSILGLVGGRPSSAFQEFAERVRALYSAVQRVSGAEVVIDASKTPVDALLLMRSHGLKCSLVHLVRDSRGVAWSWAKQGMRLPQDASGAATMLSYAPFHTAPRWVYANLWFEFLRAIAPTARVRYEDLVESPRQEIEEALRRCGMPTDGRDMTALGRGSVRLGELHTLGGNPMRFQQGDQRVRLDEEWRRGLGPRQRRLVTALTLPLLVRYGYETGPRAA